MLPLATEHIATVGNGFAGRTLEWFFHCQHSADGKIIAHPQLKTDKLLSPGIDVRDTGTFFNFITGQKRCDSVFVVDEAGGERKMEYLL